MKLPCLTLALLFTGCYGGYYVEGPAAYAGPTYYTAYPCDWGTCYYDGPRLVYYERAPVPYYGGLAVQHNAGVYYGPAMGYHYGMMPFHGPYVTPGAAFTGRGMAGHPMGSRIGQQGGRARP